VYATPLDMITKLDRRRQLIAVLSLVVFVVTIVPIPFTFVSEGTGGLESQGAMLTVGLVTMLNMFRKR